MNKVGNAIKERRKILKITQRTLAELAGVGINTLTKLSAEKGIPRSKFLKNTRYAGAGTTNRNQTAE